VENELNRGRMGTKAAWTPERRARQAEIIRQAKPWEQSTGPKTQAGKAASSRNACSSEFEREARSMRAEIMASARLILGRRRSRRSNPWNC
jgi:hypothetical protein